MKCFVFVLCLTVLAVSSTSAQQFRIDVVYLNDGSIIKGIIVEQIPGVSLKIKTADGSVFAINMSDVVKTGKELPKQQSGQFERKSPGVALALS